MPGRVLSTTGAGEASFFALEAEYFTRVSTYRISHEAPDLLDNWGHLQRRYPMSDWRRKQSSNENKSYALAATCLLLQRVHRRKSCMILRYFEVAVIVFGLNLLPAFGPPTWAVLVLFKLNWHLNPWALVVVGVVCAGVGRFLLALATKRARKWLPKKRVDSLKAVGTYLRKHRAGSAAGLAVFAVSPLPSAQLFEAAALADLPLVPIVAAFTAGRIVTYSLYLGGATAAEKSFGDTFRKALTSPYAIGIELLVVIVIVLLARVDWAKRLHSSPAA